MAKIEFEALDLNEIANEATRANTDPRQKKGNSEYFFMEKDGYSIIRFLPKVKGTRFFQETRIHALTSGSNKRQFHCTRTLTKKPDSKTVWMPPADGQPDCCICKYYNMLWQKGDRLTGKAKEDMQKSPEQLEKEKREIIASRLIKLKLDGQTKDDLIKQAENFYQVLINIHSQIYDLTEKHDRQKYDVKLFN
jgi:hypothetical protein